MMKHEFEALALKKDEKIKPLVYTMVEHFYTSRSEYHRQNGGIEETKQAFVNRVFGGKVNTPKTIMKKLVKEAIKENRFAMKGLPASETYLKKMDNMIRQHYYSIAS